MVSGLHDQQHGYKTAKNSANGVWSRLRVWLFSSSTGAVALLVPTVALAQTYHHAHTAHHDVDSARAYVLPVAYRHDQREYRPHVVNVDYRSTHQRDWRERDKGVRPIQTDYTLRRDRDHHYSHYIRYSDYERYHNHHYHSYARFSYSRLQCVPYAREVSHIELSGDAFLWWAEAAGRYERGHIPIVGSVLNFRSTGRMPLGHVAVVTAVVDSRTILVTQANWVPGTITNDVTVEDVSPQNNWSDVRVEYGSNTDMGSVYPTYGFIYNRPAHAQTIYAASTDGAGQVAQAPVARQIATQAPNRNLQ